MIFSEEIKQKAIESFNGELAWKKEDVFLAINELTDNNYAMLGGDVWAIYANNQNLENLTQISPDQIAVSIIKGEDGQEYVFSWSSDKKQNETWEDFVLRSKHETLNLINIMKVEDTVVNELSNSIYYNLVFVNKEEYDLL